MSARTDIVTDEYDRPVPGANIYVFNQDLTYANLTSNGSSPLAQPVVADQFGSYTYYANDNVYQEQVYFDGKLRYKAQVFVGNPPQFKGNPGSPGAGYATIAAMQAAAGSATDGDDFYETETGGQWIYRAGDYSAQATLDTQGGIYRQAGSIPTSTGALIRDTKVTNPRHFGAKGDGVTDDTIAFFKMAVLISYGYAPPHVVIEGAFGPVVHAVYLISKLIWRNYFPAGTLRTEVEGFNTFTSVTNASTAGPYFVGIDGLTIEGRGLPLIKRAASGCLVENTLSTGGALLNFKRCTNVKISGCSFDGNRVNQANTSGMSSGAINYGIQFVSDCADIDVSLNVFRGSGTLQSSFDKGGDDILLWSGVHRATIRHNRFFDPGRWCIALERPEPRFTDSDATQDKNIKILHNHFECGFAQDGAVNLGAIDVEFWASGQFIEVGHNYFKGSAKLSMASAPNSASQVCPGIYVHDNKFDMRGSTNPHDGDHPIGVGASWVMDQGGATVRSYQDLRVENNTVMSDKDLNGDFIAITSCLLSDAIFSGNRYEGPACAGAAGITFSTCFFENSLVIERNVFTNMHFGIQFGSWNNPTGTAPAFIEIRNNRAYNVAYGVRAVTAVPAFPAGSRFVLGQGNDFTQTTGTVIDASAFVAAGNLAIRQPGSYYGGTNNLFTGFTVTDGSAAVQPTNKTGNTTLHRPRGQITMNAAALAAGTEVQFTLTNNTILADDSVHIWVKGGAATPGSYRVRVEGQAAGSRTIFVKNETAGSLSEGVILGFAIV